MTRRQLALSLLQSAGEHGVETGEFLRAGVGSRYSARIKELRDRGWVITSQRVRDGAWIYKLISAPLESEAGVGAIDTHPFGGPDPGLVLPDGGSEARLFDPPSAWDEFLAKDRP